MGDRTSIEWTDVDLAYLAGVIDADGYITATMSTRRGRIYFGAQVGITGSRREPHDLASSLFGGNITQHQPATGRTQYHWQRGGSGAVEPITAVLPYLRVKTEQAHLVLALQDQVSEAAMFRRAGQDAYPHMPAGYDPTPSLTASVLEIRALHARTQAHLAIARAYDGYPA